MKTYVFLLVILKVSGRIRFSTAENPCCSFPCQNGGVCMTMGHDNYLCDCANTGYYGDYCETATFWQGLKNLLRPHPDTTNHLLTDPGYKWIWDVINNIPFLHSVLMRLIYLLRAEMVDSPAVYTSAHTYVTFEAAANTSYFMRGLPPVPTDCPTPMGVAGKSELPDVDYLVERLFRRHTFTAETYGSNLLFTFFAQHFTHMFFKTDVNRGAGFTWGGHGVDVSHIYGPEKDTENKLRAFKDGRLKTQTINGEEWPPLISQSPVKMLYPANVPREKQFAIGHEFFGLLPGLFVYATIWLREHNRVCDVLKSVHPEWDDEQLFQTAKLVILGETIKIVVEDYVQHLSRYNFKLTFEPELLFGQSFQYQNRISVEFNHLYHWHPLMPDRFNISGRLYEMPEFLFNTDVALEHGLTTMVDSFARQPAGKMTYHNHANVTLEVAKDTILQGRQLRLQPLNEYRKKFRLHPHTSFGDLTDDREIAEDLERLYGDIDAVEFYVGLMVEAHRPNSMFGPTIIEVGGPFSVKGLMSNPICSPKYWRPSTFGGDVGFDIIKTASLKKLFCRNLKGECPPVSFSVPMATDPVSQCEDEDCLKVEL
uniref:prostaglandin-endoperoxide synthase n=1 Tax=Arabella sp. JCH-2014 TaxID=1541963 RepID=A0A0U2KAU9_9ANNE|nr:cyclooxygenase [Arabella sp. JCH-2014]